MAANSNSRGIANFGKRFVNQIWSTSGNSRHPSPVTSSPVSGLRRGVHTSVYDKNVDDQLRPNVVPDDVIEPHSDKYWAPHPKTGVFGPATEANGPAAVAERGLHSSPASGAAAGDGDTVLEQKAWFRPLEDVEKQPY